MPLSLLVPSLQDAERPSRHSHAERGNENVLVPTLRVGMPAATLRVEQRERSSVLVVLVPTLRVGMPAATLSVEQA
jgi:hypothetical protein